MSSGSRTQKHIYSGLCLGLLTLLLVFSPMARGSVHGWQQTVIMILAFSMAGILLLEKGLRDTPHFSRKPLDLPLAALCLLCLISTMFSRSMADSIEGMMLFGSYLCIYYTTIYSIRTRKQQRLLLFLLAGMAGVLSLIGFFKMAGLTLSFWHYPELDVHNRFLTGVYGNHNHMAGYLEMVIPLALVLLLMRGSRGGRRYLIIGLAAFLILALLLTLSRGGWTALGGSMLFLTLVLLGHKPFKRKKMVLVLFGSGCLIALIFLSGADIFERALTLTDNKTMEGLGGRIIAWKGTIDMIQAHPLLGSGPATYASVAPQFQHPGVNFRFYQAHNDYLQYLAELGCLFLPIMLWLLASFYRFCRGQLASPSRQTRAISLGCMTGVTAILIHSFVDFNLHIPANAVLFSVLCALPQTSQAVQQPPQASGRSSSSRN